MKIIMLSDFAWMQLFLMLVVGAENRLWMFAIFVLRVLHFKHFFLLTFEVKEWRVRKIGFTTPKNLKLFRTKNYYFTQFHNKSLFLHKKVHQTIFSKAHQTILSFNSSRSCFDAIDSLTQWESFRYIFIDCTKIIRAVMYEVIFREI